MLITVNGIEKSIRDEHPMIGYDHISMMAFGKVKYGLTCTYSNPSPNTGGGHLTLGETIEVKNGMHFNIANTNNA